MCKYKQLKPNQKVLLLYMESAKHRHNKDKFHVKEISKEIDMNPIHVRSYLKQLEELGHVSLIKYGNMLEVFLS